MADEIIQYNRLAPYIEERGKQLLAATFGDPNAVQQPGESDADFQARHYDKTIQVDRNHAFWRIHCSVAGV